MATYDEEFTDADFDALDKFGQLLMEKMRDRGIEYFDRLAESRWAAPSLSKLQTDLASMNEEQIAIVRRCVVSAIDNAIHDFLFALHERNHFQEDMLLLVDSINIEQVSNRDVGGMHYEPFGDDGWQERFSKFGEAPEEA